MATQITPAFDLQYTLDFHRGADEALRDEIAAVERAERREAVPIHDGRRAADHPEGDAVRYVFQTEGPARLHVGERVRCHVDGAPPVRATVVGHAATRLTLALEANLGPRIDAAVVQRDAAWIEAALRSRLGAIAGRLQRGEPTGPFSPERALAVLRPEDAAAPPPGFRPLPLPTHLADAAAGLPLNEEQLTAVRRVLEQPLTYLWGPPGTGKTSTCASAIAALLAHGERILVVTPSNAAADVLLTQLHARVADHPLIARGLVQRFGSRVTDQLPPALHDLFVPSAIADRLREENDAVATWLAEERADAASTGRTADVDMLDAELASLAQERDRIGAELARNCLVTVTPIANVYLARALWRQWDAVVCDEASAVALPALYLAAGLARSRVVVAGDFQQLGAVTAADTPAVRAWLKRDLFRVAGIPEMLATGETPPYVTMLREQYRMAPAICDLVSEDYYLGQLSTAPARRAAGAIPAPAPLGSHPVVLIDTSSLEPTMRAPDRANPVHARLVAALVDAVKAPRPDGSSARVGVFTLYRGQVAALQRAASGRRRADLTATVHRSQGGEVDVAILDLCDAPGAGVTFLRANACTQDGGRLLNVALTRARQSAVIVANVAYLARTGGPVVCRLLRRLGESAALIDAWDFVS
jgi:hypothetical protein